MRTRIDTAETADGRSETSGPPTRTGHRWVRARLIVRYGTVLAILPYLVLKLSWISGATLGIYRVSPLDPAVVRAGNIVTVFLELVAIVVVVVCTHPSGLRLPGWLVLTPAWIGIGLLAPFVVTGPVVTVSIATDAAGVGDESMAPWVGPLVYLGFGAQAVGVVAAFGILVRDRWAGVLTRRLSDHPIGSATATLAPVSWVLVALLFLVAVARSSWSLGVEAGLSPALIQNRGMAERLNDAASAAFAIAAIVGLLMLVHRRRFRISGWVPVASAWIGAGATLTSGGYALVLLFTKLAGGSTAQPGVVPFVDLLQVAVGTALAAAGAVLLAELHTAVEPNDPDTTPRRLPGALSVAQ